MARYQYDDDAQMVMVPMALETQRMPGTIEFAIHVLVQRHIHTAIFSGRYQHDATGCPAYDPKILRKMVLRAYARGIMSLRKIEQACRENMTFMALTYGLLPDHSTSAPFSASMPDELASLVRDILLVCEEQGL